MVEAEYLPYSKRHALPANIMVDETQFDEADELLKSLKDNPQSL
jgi:hypothetical protein